MLVYRINNRRAEPSDLSIITIRTKRCPYYMNTNSYTDVTGAECTCFQWTSFQFLTSWKLLQVQGSIVCSIWTHNKIFLPSRIMSTQKVRTSSQNHKMLVPTWIYYVYPVLSHSEFVEFWRYKPELSIILLLLVQFFLIPSCSLFLHVQRIPMN